MQLRPHAALPALSYAGLGALAAGAGRYAFGVYAWKGVALVAGGVGLPMLLSLVQLLTVGGPGIAKMMGGQPADAHLRAAANEAAAAVGVPPPKHVFECARAEPNAFATSGLFMDDSTVAVTSGLRRALSPTELKAVLAHEMGHLRHDDVPRNMHIGLAVAGLGGMYELGRMLLRSSGDSDYDEDEDGGGTAGLGLALMAAGVGAQAVAHLLQLAASRGSELEADRAAADAFGSDAMISALRKISRAAAAAPADLREGGPQLGVASGFATRSMAHAMISDGPSKRGGSPGIFGRVAEALQTHPPLEVRVEALEAAAAQGLVPSSTNEAYLRKMQADPSFAPLPFAVDPLLLSWFLPHAAESE